LHDIVDCGRFIFSPLTLDASQKDNRARECFITTGRAREGPGHTQDALPVTVDQDIEEL
jgi:hypothetical protein